MLSHPLVLAGDWPAGHPRGVQLRSQSHRRVQDQEQETSGWRLKCYRLCPHWPHSLSVDLTLGRFESQKSWRAGPPRATLLPTGETSQRAKDTELPAPSPPELQAVPDFHLLGLKASHPHKTLPEASVFSSVKWSGIYKMGTIIKSFLYFIIYIII